MVTNNIRNLESNACSVFAEHGYSEHTIKPVLFIMGHEKFSDTAYYIHLLPENLLSSAGVDWSAIDSVNPEVSVWRN